MICGVCDAAPILLAGCSPGFTGYVFRSMPAFCCPCCTWGCGTCTPPFLLWLLWASAIKLIYFVMMYGCCWLVCIGFGMVFLAAGPVELFMFMLLLTACPFAWLPSWSCYIICI